METKVTRNIAGGEPLQTRTLKYVKILHESMFHCGFEYKLGLNVDHRPINPYGFCEPDRLCFTVLDTFYKFLDHGTLIADVEVPEGVDIYAEPTRDNSQPYKWKAHSIIISNIRKVSELPQWNDYSFWLAVVQKDENAIRFVPAASKTTELCLTAIQQNGCALDYIPDDMITTEMCLVAVQQDKYALLYVPEDMITTEICLAAVRQDGCALDCVPEDMITEAICLAAVRQDGYALEFVPENMITTEICLAAVRQDERALKFIP